MIVGPARRISPLRHTDCVDHPTDVLRFVSHIKDGIVRRFFFLICLSVLSSEFASAGNVTARVRLSETAGYGYAGLATWGEVEDYRVTIVQQSSSSSLASKIIHWNKELTDEVFKSHMDDVEAFFEGLTDDTASS